MMELQKINQMKKKISNIIEERHKTGQCVICSKDITSKLSTGDTKVVDKYIICKNHYVEEKKEK